MRSTSAILCGLFATLATAVCPAAVYNYSAYDAPHQTHDATLNQASPAPDVWSVYSDGNPDSSGDGDFRAGTPGVGNSPWGLRLTDTINDVKVHAAIPSLINEPLLAGSSIAIDFNNGLVPGGGVGIFLYPLNADDGLQAAFTLFAGDDQYRRIDAENLSGTLTEGFDATTDPFNVKFTLLDNAGGYQMDVTRGADVLYSSGPQTFFLQTADINSIEIESSVGSSDPSSYIYFNNLTINAVPEASSAVLLPVALATIGISTWIGRQLRTRLARRVISS